MKTLQEIKNTYAQEQGYADWRRLKATIQLYSELETHMDEICIRAQKAALEKAADSLDFKMINTINEKKEDKIACRYDYTSVIVDRTSITNPENLIR